jgi:hypothetical protein
MIHTLPGAYLSPSCAQSDDSTSDENAEEKVPIKKASYVVSLPNFISTTAFRDLASAPVGLVAIILTRIHRYAHAAAYHHGLKSRALMDRPAHRGHAGQEAE